MFLDAIVVGLGGVGSFALNALSKKTRNVVGIEQFQLLHSRGSSHGGSRIYRRAYFEHSHYVPWIAYSIDRFRELEKDSGNSLLEQCGVLVMEEPANDAGVLPVIQSCEKSALQHGIAVERLCNSQLTERYPQFQSQNTKLVGLLETEGGFVRPERAMEAAITQAKSKGATLYETTRVRSIREVASASHVEVEIEGNNDDEVEVLSARSVIVTAGAWATTLIPAWQSRLQPTRQLQMWLDVSKTLNPDLYQPTNMPVWYLSSPSKSKLPLYGIPADPLCENPNWIKIGLHLRDDMVDPDKSRQELSVYEEEELRDAAECALDDNQHLSWASAKPCLYTMTPDSHFMVGSPANCPRTFVAAGLSGHGFKMTPALGQMLCDMALGEDTSSWRAEFLSPERFQL